tara:strand:- start:271 stop:672 length:402 start_codon:yes stop_codon:yes gene_type:complete
MASVGTGAVRIIDNDNDVVSVTNNKLDVNATLVAGTSIDIGDVEILGHSIIASAAINLTDSAAQLSNVSCKHVDVMANLSNTGIVYIGSSGVDATTGIALYPGDVYSVDIDTLALLYAMSTVSGDDINVALFT